MKFELTEEVKVFYGIKLHRIKALTSFRNVQAGDLGGWIEKEENLSQEGDAWVCGDARVYGNAELYGNAEVCGNAWVCGDARVYGDARVCGNAEVCGDARVYGNAELYKLTHILQIGFIGSRNDTTTFFRTKDKEIFVKCGCFKGYISEFEIAVKNTHKDNKHAKAYQLAIELAKLQIDLD